MTQIQIPERFYTPYLKEQYSWKKYRYESCSISPNNKYLVVVSINHSSHNKQIDLFEICDSSDTEPHITFCNTLLVLNPEHNNISSDIDDIYLGYTWSSSGYKLICEYQERETDDDEDNKYIIVYFDIPLTLNSKLTPGGCKYGVTPKPLFANKKYEWEHNMHFSNDDSMLVTVYNREYIRIFAFEHKNKNYVFKYGKKFGNEIANIHLTADNKLIVTECNNMNYCFVKSYQISDDLSELIELNSIPFHAEYKFTFDSLNCIDHTYLVYSLSDNILAKPKSIIVYNVITLNIHEVIDFKDFGIKFIDFYNGRIICKDINGELNLFNILTHTLTPLNTHSIISKMYHKNYFVTDKYHIYQFDNADSQLFIQKFKLYANEKYKSMSTESNILDISEIYPIHITPNYIIIKKHDDTGENLYIANSVQFCNKKNCELLTQMLYAYTPVELCSQIANYI